MAHSCAVQTTTHIDWGTAERERNCIPLLTFASVSPASASNLLDAFPYFIALDQMSGDYTICDWDNFHILQSVDGGNRSVLFMGLAVEATNILLEVPSEKVSICTKNISSAVGSALCMTMMHFIRLQLQDQHAKLMKTHLVKRQSYPQLTMALSVLGSTLVY